LRRKKLPFSVMSIPPVYRRLPLPVAALARCIAPAGAALDLWTVNDPNAALRHWRSGVRAILTDDPAKIIAARRTLG
jgi:glycerophosphoryl diester phosphodiesterase